MTYEEALKEINKSLAVAIHNWYDPTDEYQREKVESLQKAKEAIEKQIPKKPKTTVFGFAKKSYDYICPFCHSRMISKSDGEWCAGAKYKFCVNCGQAIDWSEET